MFELFYQLYGLNQKLFILINQYTNYYYIAHILKLISSLFAIQKFPLYIAIYTIYNYTILLKIFNKYEQIKNFWKIYFNLAKTCITYFIFGITFLILKFTINLPRPFCILNENNFITIHNTETERCLSSFPSSHAGIVLLSTYLIWNYTSHIQKVISILLISIVSISRITLAMHFPTDIIYSFIITLVVIKISNLTFNRFKYNLILKIGKILKKILIK